MIPANDSTSLRYDFDDINLCWLLVRNSPLSPWKIVPSPLAEKRGCAEKTPDAPRFP